MSAMILLFVTLVAQDVQALAAKDFEAVIDEGVRLHDAGDYDGAIAAYARVLAVDPKNETAIHETAFSLFAKGSHAEVISLCRKAIADRVPTSPGIHLSLGNALDVTGQPAESQKVYRQALKSWPRSQQLHYNLGVNLAGQGLLREAEEEFDLCLGLDERHPGTWLALSAMASETGRPLDAWLAALRYTTLSADGPARQAAARQLWDLIFASVKAGKPGDATAQDNVTITLSDDAKLMGQEMVLAIVGASRSLDENAGLSDAQFFAEAVDSVTAMATELPPSKGKHDGPIVARAYLTDLRAAGHVEALAWSLREASGDPEAGAWVAEHAGPVSSFRAWNHQWSFTRR